MNKLSILMILLNSHLFLRIFGNKLSFIYSFVLVEPGENESELIVQEIMYTWIWIDYEIDINRTTYQSSRELSYTSINTWNSREGRRSLSWFVIRRCGIHTNSRQKKMGETIFTWRSISVISWDIQSRRNSFCFYCSS